jgi:hypothetical protein
VFELILWEQALSPRQLGLKRAVLRQKYGVGAVDLGPGGRSRT